MSERRNEPGEGEGIESSRRINGDESHARPALCRARREGCIGFVFLGCGRRFHVMRQFRTGGRELSRTFLGGGGTADEEGKPGKPDY